MIAHVINCHRNGGRIPQFAGIGSVDRRVFLFGGKDTKIRAITPRSFEIVWNEDDDVMDLIPVARMFNKRCRATVASIDLKLKTYDPFIVVIGGSDDEALKSCELYYPKDDHFYSFPSLNTARENASSCTFKTSDGIFLYCFGGFDKRAIDDIERIKIEFSLDEDETHFNKRPIVDSKWELIKNVSLVKSVECCGTYQLSENEIMIFGGF
jgi:hypothetical protein